MGIFIMSMGCHYYQGRLGAGLIHRLEVPHQHLTDPPWHTHPPPRVHEIAYCHRCTHFCLGVESLHLRRNAPLLKTHSTCTHATTYVMALPSLYSSFWLSSGSPAQLSSSHHPRPYQPPHLLDHRFHLLHLTLHILPLGSRQFDTPYKRPLSLNW